MPLCNAAGEPIFPAPIPTGKVLCDTGELVDMGGGGPHTHPESDITSLVSDLAGKEASGTAAAERADHEVDFSHALLHSNTLDHDGGAQDTVITSKETPAGAQGKVDTHAAVVLSVHGGDAQGKYPSTPTLAGAEASGAVATHAALPSAHHTAFVQADHDALPNPHHSNSLDHNGGTQDTAIAGKEPANSNIQAHVTGTGSPHTAAGVGALATGAFGGLAKITVAGTAPSTPGTGDLWIDTA